MTDIQGYQLAEKYGLSTVEGTSHISFYTEEARELNGNMVHWRKNHLCSILLIAPYDEAEEIILSALLKRVF